MPPWPGSVRRRTRTTLRRPERGPRGRRQRGRGAYAARARSRGTPEHRRIGGAISSHAQPLPVLAPARAAPEPTLGDARHDAPAVRTPLIVAPAPEEAEPDRERRADYQRWREDGLHDKHASRGSRSVKHGGARRRPGHRRMGRDLLQFLEKLFAELLGFGVLALAVKLLHHRDLVLDVGGGGIVARCGGRRDLRHELRALEGQRLARGEDDRDGNDDERNKGSAHGRTSFRDREWAALRRSCRARPERDNTPPRPPGC